MNLKTSCTGLLGDQGTGARMQWRHVSSIGLASHVARLGSQYSGTAFSQEDARSLVACLAISSCRSQTPSWSSPRKLPSISGHHYSCHPKIWQVRNRLGTSARGNIEMYHHSQHQPATNHHTIDSDSNLLKSRCIEAGPQTA